jgi:hypothetical protein
LIFPDIDPALKKRAVLNDDPLCRNVSYKHGRFSQLHAIGSGNIAVDFAEDHQFLSIDIGLYPPVGTDREIVAMQLNAALHFSIQVNILATGKLTLNHH